MAADSGYYLCGLAQGFQCLFRLVRINVDLSEAVAGTPLQFGRSLAIEHFDDFCKGGDGFFGVVRGLCANHRLEPHCPGAESVASAFPGNLVEPVSNLKGLG